MATILGVVLAVCLICIVVVPLLIFEAFVLSTLWAWFVVTTFGLPALTLPVAIGIKLVFSILMPTPYFKTSEDNKESAKKVGLKIVGGLIMLLIGYIVKSCFM